MSLTYRDSATVCKQWRDLIFRRLAIHVVHVSFLFTVVTHQHTSEQLRPSSYNFPASIKYLNSENVFLIKMFIWREKTSYPLYHIYLTFLKQACFPTLPQATCTHPFCSPHSARQNWSCHPPHTAKDVSATKQQPWFPLVPLPLPTQTNPALRRIEVPFQASSCRQFQKGRCGLCCSMWDGSIWKLRCKAVLAFTNCSNCLLC